MQKKVFFWLIALLNCIDFTNYVFLVPIMPDFLKSYGVGFTLIGFILSFYQASNVIACIYFAKNLVKLSKAKVIIVGQTLLVASNLAMGFLNMIQSVATVVALTIVLRLIQGVAMACVSSSTYSYVPILYPTELDRKYAFMEICSGLGLALGPPIAGFLYEYLDFTWTFLTVSIVYFAFGAAIFPFLIAAERTLTAEAKAREEEEGATLTPKKPLSVRKILKNKDFLLTLFVFMVCIMSYCMIQPGFSNHVHSYGGSDEVVGLIFGLGDLTYGLTGFVMMHFISGLKLPRKYLFMFGGFLSAICLLLMGPETYTFIPKGLIPVIISIGIEGFSQMFYVPTFIPEVLEIIKDDDPDVGGLDEMASSLFIASLGITQFVGNILGGYLCDAFGFDRGMAIYALFIIAYLIFYGFAKKIKQKEQQSLLENAQNANPANPMSRKMSYDQTYLESPINVSEQGILENEADLKNLES